MTAQEIHTLLTEQFGAAVLSAKLENVPDPFVVVAAPSIAEIAQFAKKDERLSFDFLSCLSGVDYKGKLGVTYHLYSMTHRHKIVLKVEVPTDAPSVPSVSSVWGTAEWHEREAFDMLGLRFEGNPDLRRILLPDDWEGHPLRKDYQTPEFYNGMRIPY